MKQVARFKILAAAVGFPGKREKRRARREQKRPAFNFPMEVSFGNVMQLKPAVLVLGQPRNTAAAKFLEEVKELARFAGQTADHDDD
jgi:hypothetical protein